MSIHRVLPALALLLPGAALAACPTGSPTAFQTCVNNRLDALAAASSATQGDVTALQDADVDLDARVGAAEATLAADAVSLVDHETRLANAEGTLVDHETRLATSETTGADHDVRLGIAEVTLADHEARITTAEAFDILADAMIGDLQLQVGDALDWLALLDFSLEEVSLAVDAIQADYATSADVSAVENALLPLEVTLSGLDADVTLAFAALDTLTTEVDAIQADYVTSSDLSGLATEAWVSGQGFVDGSSYPEILELDALLDVDGTAVSFVGANVYVQSGSGATDGTVNGLGNLIVGYDENSGDTKTGSHNLVVGRRHTYTSYGGVISGNNNAINGPYAGVIASSGSDVNNPYAGVFAGNNHSVSADYAAVVAGSGGTVTGWYGLIAGGRDNVAEDTYASVFGGEANYASNQRAVVVGGYLNEATSPYTAVMGGESNRASNDYATAVGGFDNHANADWATVSGGNTVTVSTAYGVSP